MAEITAKQINEILGITDPWKAPERLMEILLGSRINRERTFMGIIRAADLRLDYDWFRGYFEEEAAERKGKKQDFTPDSVSKLLSEIVGGDGALDIASGTGSLLIQKWFNDLIKVPVLRYYPSNYLYFAEELSDRAIPFLLFNLAARGMNATVIHIDSLSRENCKGVYFLQNIGDSFLGFSSINVMPMTAEVNSYFNIKSWDKNAVVDHIEDTEWPEYLTRRGAVYSDEKK